jgi:hypothetical protein
MFLLAKYPAKFKVFIIGLSLIIVSLWMYGLRSVSCG